MADIPEQIDIIAQTTGPKGGDAGHGGSTGVTFVNNGFGCNIVEIRLRDGGIMELGQDEWDAVTVTSSGDWEGCGMHIGIREAAALFEWRWAEYTKLFEADMTAMVSGPEETEA
jgi:hypothetical protein